MHHDQVEFQIVNSRTGQLQGQPQNGILLKIFEDKAIVANLKGEVFSVPLRYLKLTMPTIEGQKDVS